MPRTTIDVWVEPTDRIEVRDRIERAKGSVIALGTEVLVYLHPDAEDALRELLNARAVVLRLPVRKPNVRAVDRFDRGLVAMAEAFGAPPPSPDSAA